MRNNTTSGHPQRMPMNGLFISHAHADKPFVSRLAADLAREGFPVWFDSWELGPGDSLFAEVYGGISESQFMIAVISPASISSKWVGRELLAALAKEDDLGRPFVLPVLVSGVERPLSIADRLYVDFRSSYAEPFDKLTMVLRGQGVDKIKIADAHRLIPLQFNRVVHLDTPAFRSVLAHLNFEAQITEQQFQPVWDSIYTKLRSKLLHHIDDIVTDGTYSQQVWEYVQSVRRSVIANESNLLSGLCTIVNDVARTSHANASLAAYWYARELVTENIRALWAAQPADSSDIVEKDPLWDSWPQSLWEGSEAFYGATSIRRYDIGPRIGSHWLGPNSLTIQVDSAAAGPIEAELELAGTTPLTAVLDVPDLLPKYIIPRVLRKILEDGLPSPSSWQFENWLVGKH